MKHMGRAVTISEAQRIAEHGYPLIVKFPDPPPLVRKTVGRRWLDAAKAFVAHLYRPMLAAKIAKLQNENYALQYCMSEKTLENNQLKNKLRDLSKLELDTLNAKNKYLSVIEDYGSLVKENQSLRYSLAEKQMSAQ